MEKMIVYLPQVFTLVVLLIGFTGIITTLRIHNEQIRKVLFRDDGTLNLVTVGQMDTELGEVKKLLERVLFRDDGTLNVVTQGGLREIIKACKGDSLLKCELVTKELERIRAEFKLRAQ